MGNALDDLKKNLGEGGFDDPDPAPDGDAGLDDPLEDDPAPAGDEDTPSPGEGDDPEAAAAALAQKEESEFLQGEKTVKLESGEWISKKSFLKRMKENSLKRKEFEEKLKGYSRFDEKKDHYEHWDKNHEGYKQSVQTVQSLNRVLEAEPWLLPILKSRAAGQPINWQEIAPILKPMLSPFWDGVQYQEELDPTAAALKPFQEKLHKLEQAEAARQQETQKRQTQAREQESIQRQQAGFAEQEKTVVTKWAKFFPKENPRAAKLWRDRLYDHAASIQDTLPEGQTIDLAKVADNFFKEEMEVQKLQAEARKKQLTKSRLAGGEGGGRHSATPIPKEGEDGKPALTALQKLKRDLVADGGEKFGS